ncbi:50S ribosomal protein L15 [Patescibacteria group bacterium]|nr:50S ribosomal protein L15 [Patescibacteria group bacterium]
MSIHKYLTKKLHGKKKRIGRGYGSCKGGHTVGRGAKGQKARSKVPSGFEGGQIPLYKKIPQIGGFSNPTRKRIAAVTVDRLNAFDAGSEVTPDLLVEKGILKKLPKHGVKLLAKGKLEKKISLKGFSYSKGAEKLIKDSGSKVV